MSDNTNANTGVGFGGLLTILFVGLKLGGVINWSWWWVLSPLWISFLIAIVLIVVIAIIAALIDR